MEEKYYIDIDENRKIIGRYLRTMHGDKIPFSAQEVSQEVFNTSIQENNNYLNDDLTTCTKDVRTAEQIVEEERLAKLPSQEEILNDKITLKALELIAELGLV